MMALVEFIALTLLILGSLWLLNEYVESEVERRLNRQTELELERIQAVHAIKDEMRASSHRLLAAAIDPETGKFRTVDTGNPDRGDERS